MKFVRVFVSSLLTFTLVSSIFTPAFAADVRIVDIASVTWNGAKQSININQVEDAVKYEVGPRWKKYSTVEGSKEDKSLSFQYGVTLNQPIVLSGPMACEGSSASSFMNNVRQEAYKRLEIEDWVKRYLVILTPDAGCVWTGRALIGNIKSPGGVMTLQDSASTFVIVHELGHAIGLGHSNFLRCDSGKNDGPWGSDCKAVEYGGTVDVMGNVDVDTPLSTYSQWLLGLIDKSEIRQNWLSETVTLSAADLAGGTRVLFLRDDKSTYWIEYRRADAKATYRPGLVIYRTDPPPISAIVSPNPEDALSPEFDEVVAADVWMLNWDNYTYARSKANGSMTLPEGKTATVFSGNISIVASSTDSPDKINVTITRKPDTNPPPVPRITDPKTWRYPSVPIIEAGNEDKESAIASFEADISGKIVEILGSEVESTTPTYLNPFMSAKTVYLRDLPEGNYQLSLRAVDVWGNRSGWSQSVQTYVDRGNPIVTNEIALAKINESNAEITWNGARDNGIGLCSTQLHTPEGFVVARSKEKISPTFVIPEGKKISATAKVFDCLGNGMEGELLLSTSFVSASKSKRTGKWSLAPSTYGEGALKCSGRCTASISIAGSVQALIGAGSATISSTGKTPISLNNSGVSALKLSEALNVGSRNRVVRVSGKDFIFGGLAKFEASVGEFKPIVQLPEISDPSLVDATQKRLSNFGFNSGDFVQGWTVLPMARGTTLLDPTLDLCSANYSSELGREARRQISVTKVGSPYLFLSTEVVKYKSVQAANAALDELKKSYEVCRKNRGGTENGIFTAYDFQSMPQSSASLVSENQRVVVRSKIGTGAGSRQLLAFYQYTDDIFTGLYVVKAGEEPIPNEEVVRWLEVAEVMAKRLSTK